MTIVCSTYLDAREFTWGAGGGCAFASDFGSLARRPSLFTPIYDDACDIGCVLVNPNTGGEAVWYLHETHVDEGDVTSWELRPTPETLYRHPQLRGKALTIYND